jgi:hypothetical protein
MNKSLSATLKQFALTINKAANLRELTHENISLVIRDLRFARNKFARNVDASASASREELRVLGELRHLTKSINAFYQWLMLGCVDADILLDATEFQAEPLTNKAIEDAIYAFYELIQDSVLAERSIYKDFALNAKVVPTIAPLATKPVFPELGDKTEVGVVDELYILNEEMGIFKIDTLTHGYLRLPNEVVAIIPDVVKAMISKYSSNGWYEHHCDAPIIRKYLKIIGLLPVEESALAETYWGR